MKLHVHFSRGFLGSLNAIGAALLMFFTWVLAVQPKPPVQLKPPVSNTVLVTVLTPEQKAVWSRRAQVRAGMTEGRVKQIMGNPDAMQVVPIFNSGMDYEAWYWGDVTVDFDESGHVLPGVSPY